MAELDGFLSPGDEAEIVEAIVQAEKYTSGEIRVHIEPSTALDPFDRAKELFHYLKMDNTKQDNGVLLYVAVKDRKFVICGGPGIDRAVPKDFWDTTKEAIAGAFKKGNFKQGIIAGITMAGKELQVHFPWDNNDTNELSDAISKG